MRLLFCISFGEACSGTSALREMLRKRASSPVGNSTQERRKSPTNESSANQSLSEMRDARSFLVASSMQVLEAKSRAQL